MKALSVNAQTTGNITLTGDVTATNGAVNFNSTSADHIGLNGNVTATNGNIDFQSKVFLTSPVTVQATAGHIEFHHTLDSNGATPEDLTLKTLTSGDILLDQAVGFTNKLGNLTVTGAGEFTESAGVKALSVNAQTTGNITLTGDVTATNGAVNFNSTSADHIGLNGNVTATNGNIDFQSKVFLTSPVTVQATAGHIEFHHTLDSNGATPEDLTLKTLTSGDILLDQAVGATNKLGNLTVTGAGEFTESAGVKALSVNAQTTGNITLTGDVTATNGAVNFNSTSADHIGLNGNVTATNGNIDFQSKVFLTSPVTVQATAGHIEFHHTLDSNGATPEDLTLKTLTSGDILLDQAVGATNKLGNLTVTGAGEFTESAGVKALSVNAQTTGNITLTGDVTATNGAVNFNSTSATTSA